jgi:hypothetical protein
MSEQVRRKLKAAMQENARLNSLIANSEQENARLKAEVERLRSASFVTAVPSEQYERVVKAGDDMAAVITQYRCSPWGRKVPNAFAVWDAWFAAKGSNR